MRTGGYPHMALRYAVWVGAVVAAPLLLIAGGPVYDRYLRHLCREGGPGLLDKEKSWMHPGYWVVMNPLVRALTWPTRSRGRIKD